MITRRTLLGAAAAATFAGATLAATGTATAGIGRPGSCALGGFVKADFATNRDGVSQPKPLEDLIGRRLEINHSFQHWVNTVVPSSVDDDIAAGRTSMISWGAGPQAVLEATARGDNDAFIKAQAKALRDKRHPIFLRYSWEMDLEQRGYTPSTFVDAWQRTYGLFQEVSAKNVTFTWCPTWLGFRTGLAEEFYPGREYVHWIAADGYARDADNYRSMAFMFPEFHAFGTQEGKPMMIGETGVAEDPDDPGNQARWLRQSAIDLKTTFTGVRAVCFFDTPDANHTNDWQLEGNPQTEAAVVELAADPYFQT